MKTVSFTKEEVEVIKKMYPTASRKEIEAVLPGHRWGKIVGCATRNGAYRKVDFKQGLFESKFSQEQDELLKSIYPQGKKEEILNLFKGFTWNAIVRRADKIDVKRDLSFVHTKNYLSSGESVNDFANSKGIPLSSANKIFNKHGEEFLQEYNPSSNENLLELNFRKLLEKDFPIERWNCHPEDVNLSYKPDFRIEKKVKVKAGEEEKEEVKVLYLNIDGLHYHSDKNQTNPRYHFKMQQDFKSQNLSLMQFRSDELDSAGPIIKSIVNNYFGVNLTKIGARSCELRPVDQKEATEFFNENHLMGFTKVPTYGLYSKSQLVAAMSYRMKGSQLEIARFCSKINHTVHGAFSKLLDFLVEKEKPSHLVSFCDLRYSTGKSYDSYKFDLVGITLGWKWTNGVRTYNRKRCQANMDERELSQAEQAAEFCWFKIYDAGQAKYVKVLDKTKTLTEEDEGETEVDIFDTSPRESKVNFWTKEERDMLKRLSEEYLSKRSIIIKLFRETYPLKTEAAIIRQISNLKLTHDNKIYMNVGDNFGYWTVIEVPKSGQKVKCKCICGIEKMILKNHIKHNKSKSCGCMSVLISKKTCIAKYNTAKPSQTQEVKDKITQTSLEKYGEKRFSQTQESKDKMKLRKQGEHK